MARIVDGVLLGVNSAEQQTRFEPQLKSVATEESKTKTYFNCQ